MFLCLDIIFKYYPKSRDVIVFKFGSPLLLKFKIVFYDHALIYR